MRVSLPTSHELTELMTHRNDASVTIYLPSSPVPRDVEAVQLRLKNAASDADAQLAKGGVSTADRGEIARMFDALQTDRSFWQEQARSLTIFASPAGLRAFRLANTLQKHVAVGDRFDVGPLLRAVSFPNGGYVLTVTENANHLYEIFPDGAPTEIPLEDLPDDVERFLSYDVGTGRMDRHRAAGATGQRIEQQRFCSLVQDAALKAITDPSKPLILSASRTLEPAYRAINTYSGLLETGIDVHPESLTIQEIDVRAREILDTYYAADLAAWRDRFESLRSEGRATSQLSEVARGATSGAIEHLLFDIESTALEGTIDEAGVVETAAEPGPHTYGILDEIAVRTYQSGGTVQAVRASDLPDDSPVAATLRFAP